MQGNPITLVYQMHQRKDTQENQVYMAPRQERHLEHKLGHVVQQKQGIVKPTGRIDNVPINDDQNLEKLADSSVFHTEQRVEEKENIIQGMKLHEMDKIINIYAESTISFLLVPWVKPFIENQYCNITIDLTDEEFAVSILQAIIDNSTNICFPDFYFSLGKERESDINEILAYITKDLSRPLPVGITACNDSLVYAFNLSANTGCLFDYFLANKLIKTTDKIALGHQQFQANTKKLVAKVDSTKKVYIIGKCQHSGKDNRSYDIEDCSIKCFNGKRKSIFT